MTADIGYLQNKIRELNEKIDMVDAENKRMTYLMEENQKMVNNAETKLKAIIDEMQSANIVIVKSKIIEILHEPLLEFSKTVRRDVDEQRLEIRKQFDIGDKHMTKVIKTQNYNLGRSMREMENEIYNNFFLMMSAFSKQNNLKFTKPTLNSKRSEYHSIWDNKNNQPILEKKGET